MRGYENSKIPKLFELMAERRLRAKDICDATGITQGSITDWKSGRSVPSSDKLIVLANYLDVPVEYIMGTDVPEQNAMDLKIQAEAKQLSENQKADVLKYIEFIKTKD